MYCAGCAAELPGDPPVACAACGRWTRRNPKPAANALVTDDRGRLLLVHRAHDPWRGRWCAPGGFCEHLEHPVDTAIRETLEETGIAIEVIGYLGTWMSYYAEDDLRGTGSPEDVSISVSYYHGRALGEPAAGHVSAEIARAEWFAADELPELVAPPHALSSIAEAWRSAIAAGATTAPLHGYRPSAAADAGHEPQ